MNTIEITKDNKDIMNHLANGLSKDHNMRPALCAFSVEKDVVTTANGFVLTTVPKDLTPFAGMEPGLYKVLDLKRTPGIYRYEIEPGSYPNWRELLPLNTQDINGQKRKQDTMTLALDVDLLTSTIKDAGKVNKCIELTINTENPDGPILISAYADNARSMQTIIMPLDKSQSGFTKLTPTI